MKSLFLPVAFVFAALFSVAQSPLPVSLGDFKSMKKTDNGIIITTTFANCRVLIYSPAIIRVSITKFDQFNDFSYAVIVSPSKDKFTLNETATQITLSTDSVQLVITKKPVRLTFLNKKGRVVNADDAAFGTSFIGHESITYKKLFPGERFIGLGEKTGPLDRRGQGYTNWNTDYFGYAGNGDPIYSSIPFYMGLHDSLVYGVFLDNSFRTNFNFGASNDRFSFFSADDGDMNYYLIYRSSVAGVIESYTQLTGRMELPPLWALGFQQCRYSYYPQQEVLTLAQTFRDRKIPCDVIYLDIHYMQDYKLFTWNKERFPDPKGMLAKLNDEHFKVVTIIDPGIKDETGYAPNEEGEKNNYFLKYPDGTNLRAEVWPGWCHFPDFTNPKTRIWWGTQFKGFVDDGIAGFWNDMNEPASWGQKIADNVLFDFDGHKTTMREGHNVFGLEMARSTCEGEKKLFNDKRPFTLTRAGYAGLQRYTSIWTGDNLPTDDHMEVGIRLVTSLGLSGVSFAGYDVGGFGGEATAELFARWMTIGSFCPFFRSHKMVNARASEPWSYGERVEEISRNFIQLRYNLMPYIYSTFYESTQDGMPVQRSLAINYSNDANIYSQSFQNQYLLGPALLVVPCYSTDNYKNTYLPAGKWYDLYSDKAFDGNKETVAGSPLEKLPVFVKAGSIIPMQSPVQSTVDKPLDTLYLQVYGGASGSFVYYEDAGNGYSYQKGDYCRRNMAFNQTSHTLTLDKQDGNYTSQFKYVRVYFHQVDELKNNIMVNGTAQPITNQPYDYLQPITKFDPLGTKGNADSRQLKSVLINNSKDKIELSF